MANDSKKSKNGGGGSSNGNGNGTKLVKVACSPESKSVIQRLAKAWGFTPAETADTLIKMAHGRAKALERYKRSEKGKRTLKRAHAKERAARGKK